MGLVYVPLFLAFHLGGADGQIALEAGRRVFLVRSGMEPASGGAR